MQKQTFSNGGFVLHRIPARNCNGKLSAWFDAQGALLDIEAFDKLGRAKRPSRDDKAHCVTIGKTYGNKESQNA